MTLASNKYVKKDYQILETFEAGLKLAGHEVKSIKKGEVNFKGSYISIDKNSQVWLVGVHISKYKPAGDKLQKYDPYQKRRLLLHKKEIVKLSTKSHEPGLTILPLSVYTKGSLIKLEVGIGKGKKKHDKRETIKKREVDKEIRQKMMN